MRMQRGSERRVCDAENKSMPLAGARRKDTDKS